MMLLLLIATVLTVLLTIFLLKLLQIITYHEEIPIVENLDGNAPIVSIIVPMRNEERNARQCIESLMSQKYSNFEVIVVDDRSEDNTLKVLKEFVVKHSNFKLVEGTPTPKGWVGKNHALWQGVKEAKGSWLLFVDADTISESQMLTSVIKYAEDNNIDMLSVSPFQILETFWERVIQPVIFSSIAYAFPQDKINDPKSKIAAAIGQFILIKRSVYENTGGHSTVKDKIVEDFALAQLVKRSGYRLYVMRGIKLIRTRMYTNFGELWEGWTKNLFFGLNKRWRNLIYLIALLLTWGIIPPVLFIWSVFNTACQQSLSFIQMSITFESAFLLALIIYNSWQTTRLFYIPRLYSLTIPLGVAVYIAIVLSSAYKVASGVGVSWKERVYKL
ncbi:MAG: glycosyltransferase [Deltaproteobacteria bacterium]|nr:glycosyltransferase [Deltaproteobacteria bacterium]